MLSYLCSMARALDLALDHAANTGVVYDLVAGLRCDVLLWRDLDLSWASLRSAATATVPRDASANPRRCLFVDAHSNPDFGGNLVWVLSAEVAATIRDAIARNTTDRFVADRGVHRASRDWLVATVGQSRLRLLPLRPGYDFEVLHKVHRGTPSA